MRALFLDFERNAPGARLGYGLIAIGGLLAALVLGTQLMVYQEIGRYGEIAPTAVGVRGEPVLPRGVASEAEAIEGARAVVAHLAGPWETLFRALEAIDSPDVALLALTPDMQTHKIRIYAEARSFAAMLSYYSALEQTRAFGEVALVEHEIQQSDPQRPVRFAMTAAWGGG
jgi:hypothetical protein